GLPRADVLQPALGLGDPRGFDLGWQGTVTDAVRENRSQLGALGVRELHGGFEEAFGFGGHKPSIAPEVASDDRGHSCSSSPGEERIAVARASFERPAAVVLPARLPRATDLQFL